MSFTNESWADTAVGWLVSVCVGSLVSARALYIHVYTHGYLRWLPPRLVPQAVLQPHTQSPYSQNSAY
jgi:hypothetical protein